jgi:hypothetical protein
LLDAVDWRQPWFDVWREAGARVAQACDAQMPLHDALNLDGSPPVRFVPQTMLPAGKAYEQYIFETGCCPTRDNLHDFFNGLCWKRFPLTKQRLNALQAAQISAMGVRPQRGPVRDALTLFDENAAFLQAPAELWEALVAKDWQRLFIGLRPLWRQACLVPFGHALLEKLVTPRKPVTAHVYVVQVSWVTLPELDAVVTASLSEASLGAKPFAPLPVLGIPGWWPPNENPRFYDDPQVFRAPARACL